MAGILTVMAEEMGRLVGLAWGGVGVAVKLNNTVMNTIFRAATRLVQVLMLLTQKTSDLFTILLTDFMAFLGDVGSLTLTVAGAIQTISVTTWGCICGAVTGLKSSLLTSYGFVKSSYYGCIDGTLTLFEHLGNVLTAIKQAFVLFGSSVIFLIGVIPNLMHWIVMGTLHVCNSTFLKCCEIIVSMCLNIHFWALAFKDNFISFFTDIPLEAVVGFVIGVVIIIGSKYMIDNEILVPEIRRLSSFILSLRPHVPHLEVFNIFRANHNVQHMENEVQEIFNADEGNDENGNDNNGNVPDNNLPENQAYVWQPAQVAVHQQQQQPEVEIIEDVHINVVQDEERLANNRLPVIHHILPRRPLTRSRVRIEENVSTTAQGNSVATAQGNSVATAQGNSVATVQGNSVATAQQNIEAGTSGSANSKHSDGIGGERPSRDQEWAYQLYRELEEEREDRLCIVCTDKAKCVILLPCRHLCLCDACRSAIITRDNCCPICRRPIMETLRVYV